jgi:hypothetical protein
MVGEQPRGARVSSGVASFRHSGEGRKSMNTAVRNFADPYSLMPGIES